MRSFFFCLLVLLFAAGCKKADHPDSSNSNGPDIFPNTIGDRWVYLVDDTAFNFSNTGVVTQYNMTVSITDSVQLPGSIRANRWVYNYPGGTDTNFVYQHGDTISFIANTLPAVNIVRQYIIPLRLHNSWAYVMNSIHNVTIDSQATILVGQYLFENALDIRGVPGWPDVFFNIDEWVADHVGVVKRYYNNDGYTIGPVRHRTRWTLVSYSLN